MTKFYFPKTFYRSIDYPSSILHSWVDSLLNKTGFSPETGLIPDKPTIYFKSLTNQTVQLRALFKYELG